VGDEVRIDYVGWVPSEPYGPSEAVFVVPSNNAPNAVIVPQPDPPEVELAGTTTTVVLDGSLSDDGDGGGQDLAFAWKKIRGPNGDTMHFPNRPWLTLGFTRGGKYEYQLTVDDGHFYNSTASASVVVTVNESGFLRGDANVNGKALEVHDAIHIIRYLVGQRRRARRPVNVELSCPDAADANDDGTVNLRDALFILRRRFCPETCTLFSSCTNDETPDDLAECVYPPELCSAAENAPAVSSDKYKRAKKRWTRLVRRKVYKLRNKRARCAR
jgi:hypothetical protein